MKIPNDIPVYGDVSFRGPCPTETAEQVTFFAELRRRWPDTLGIIALHPRNEQQLKKGQFSAIDRHKAEGMNPGASDVIIPGSPSFVCEMKRQDHTKSKWQEGQLPYLRAAKAKGSFVCVALGYAGAIQAVEEWEKWQK